MGVGVAVRQAQQALERAYVLDAVCLQYPFSPALRVGTDQGGAVKQPGGPSTPLIVSAALRWFCALKRSGSC